MITDWHESWDYKRISPDGPRMIASAVGPQHICIGHRIQDSDIMQPDGVTMQKVFADARKIAAIPGMIDLLKRAREELRLIEMKDCGAIYDVSLRVMLDALIAKVTA